MSAAIELLTVAETARRIGVSDSYIRKAIRGGELKAVKFGGQLRIDVREFNAWVESKTTAY